MSKNLLYKKLTLYCFKLNRILILLLFLFVGTESSAQLFSNYASSRSTGNPYSSISISGSSVGSWRNTGAFSQDDNRSLFIDIGFDFWYAGVRYTAISISTNGFIDFSNSTDDGGPNTDDFGYANTAFTEPNIANATRPAIAPMYDDLTAQGGVDSLGNAIKYQLTGTAPNRVFTIEWIDMAVYLNTTPSLNFQVKIYEKTGVIDLVYGTMINGSHAFSYTCGLNGTTMSNTPTNAQLKVQQTANTNTFSAGEVNNLVTIPATNSIIRFTPPVPANPPGPLTFSAVTNSSMTLNWANWATNEVGYVIYNSIDGINYYFVTQTAANATNANITGLSPGITYNWRVMAVTEGCLSNPLTGTQATLPAGNKLSNVANGTWNDPNDWTPVGVPTFSDNVTIRNGHTITIDVNANCNDLTVGSTGGTLIIGNNNTSRTLNIGGNITVTNTGTFRVSNTSNTTHLMNFIGKITNNGTLNFRPDGDSFCDITFSRINTQSITGTGATNNYNNFILSLGSGFNDSLFITSTIFTAPNNFLTINSGAFKLSSTNTSTFVFTNAYTIGQYAGIINDNPNATFDFQAGLTLEGLYKNMRGNLIVGNAANENLQSNGGILKIQAGTVNIAGSYFVPNINNLALFSISGGTMTLPTVGSTSTTVAPFQIVGSGSTFNMSGGSIIIQREGGTGAQNLGYVVTGATTSNVTGGTLQIGNGSTPAAQIMQINTNIGVGNLLINTANATGSLLTNHLNVINNVTIAAGTLNANTRNITLGGNWSNSGTWTPSTGTVTFGGSNNHTLVNTIAANENFNHLATTGTGTLTLNDPITLAGNINIGNGSSIDVNVANHTVNLRGNWTNNGTFIQRSGLVNMNGTVQQLFNGTATTFYNYTLNNTNGARINSGVYTINNLYTPTLGTLLTNGQTWIFESDGANESRISAFNASSGITGNVTTRRFINAGIGGYRDLGVAHLSGATVSSFDDDMYISGSTGAGFADGCAMGPPCFYSFKLLNNNNYTDITNASIVIGNTQGVHAWVADGYPSSLSAPINIDLTGTVKPFGNVNVNITGAGGTLVGNPYISQINFDNISRAGVGDYYYMYDVNITNYNWYQIANISSPLTNIISKGQGFVVYGPGTITFSETNKTGAASVFIRNQSEEVFLMDVKDLNKENVSCNAMINLTEGETGKTSIPLLKGIDTNSIYISTKGNNFSDVSYRYENIVKKDFMEIPVYIQVNSKANLQMSLLNTDLLNEFECIEIEDQLDHKIYSVEEAQLLNIMHDSSANSSPRFIIRLAKTCEDLEQNWADFYYANNHLNFTVRNASEGILTVEVIDLAGRLVLSEQIQNPTQWFQIADSDSWKNGTYITRLTTGNLSKSWKFTVIR